eukprot:g14138.t1
MASITAEQINELENEVKKLREIIKQKEVEETYYHLCWLLDSDDTSRNTSSNLVAKLRNNSLKTISFCQNNIGNEGAKYLGEALKVNTSLKKIDLWDNNIGNEGAKYIAEALKVNTSLKEINLGNNNIGDEGVKHLAEASEVNMSLKKIDLSYNYIGDKGAKYLKYFAFKTIRFDKNNGNSRSEGIGGGVESK